MKRIVFQSNQLSVRGTEVALYDYAWFNQAILGNESVVVYDRNSASNSQEVIGKFASSFKVIGYDNFSEVDPIIEREKADLFYAIKAGKRDGVISQIVPSMIHAVFPIQPSEFHGSAYAFVSDWLSMYCANRKLPAVPHIVALPDIQDDLRARLAIPASAMVFGCYGGADSFDLDFAKKCVADALEKRSDVYFLFMNIKPFVEHKRALFLPGTAETAEKVKFINSCDAMLHARKRGETFGLACAEFSLRNKPILTYSKSGERHHIDVLGEKAFLYGGSKSLMRWLLELSKEDFRVKDWDCYSAYFLPEKVMRRFQDVFIDVAVKNGIRCEQEAYPVSLDWVDKLALAARRAEMRRVKLLRLLPV